MGRLSSGYKINKAGDNPAGMAISSKMKAQIDGLDQAEANSDDGQSVLRIARRGIKRSQQYAAAYP